MKWIKHMVCSWDDEKIASAVAEHGLEIYGFWWRILEIIAKQMDRTPKSNCQYSAKVWAKFCGISAKKWRNFAGILEEKKLISLKNFGNEVSVEVPNLVKYRDEWSNRKT